MLCWLALLLIRIIETTTGDTWHNTRRHLDRIHVGTFTGPHSLFRQTTALSKPQRDLLAELDIPTPKQIIETQHKPLTSDNTTAQRHAPRRVSTRLPSSNPRSGGLSQERCFRPDTPGWVRRDGRCE